MIRTPYIRMAICAAVAVSAAVVRADIAYNNFGSGDTFSGSSWNVDPSQSLMMQFASATTGTVSSVTLALVSGASYNVYLELADNGNDPGTVLDSWMGVAGTGAAQSLSGTGSSLTAGTNYRIHIDPASANDRGGWYRNNTGAVDEFYFTAGGTWVTFTGTVSAFRVETTSAPVPEPLTSGLALLGLGLAARRRRRLA